MNPLASARRAADAAVLHVALALVAVAPLRADDPTVLVEARRGMVVSATRQASDIGAAILQRGGNAVDAAAAVAFALAVTHPEAGNLGGGGFMLVKPADEPAPVCVEYRETAPAAANEEMFVDRSSHLGHKIVGTPGTVRGLAAAHARFGVLPWRDVILPSVRLARQGFLLDEYLADSLNELLAESADYAELRRVYGKRGGAEPWRVGDRLVQADLAWSLEQIALDGPDAFYQGAIADKIVAEMQAGGGLITHDDLRAYEARFRQPVHTTYRGYDVYGPPPPSSGGTTLIEMLNILEPLKLRRHGPNAPQTFHAMIEAMRRAYRDRARWLGDPDFVEIPTFLTEKDYAREQAAGIDPHRATKSEALAGDIELAPEGPSTTHFSVIDRHGMAVSNTYTLEYSYGSRVVVRGAGFLLNNEMGDFNWRPGVTDRQGAIGTAANLIAPGKRMLSSQTPVIVTRDGRVVLVTGSPGGRTIINTVLCVVLNVLEFEMDVRAAVEAPRLHHGWFPDQVRFEAARREEFSDVMAELRAMGHEVSPRAGLQGSAHTILVDPRRGLYQGAPDVRRTGHAAGY